MSALSPKELKGKKAESIPQWFINAVNDLLVEGYVGPRRSITITQDDIIKRALEEAAKHDVSITRQQIFDFGYINFEPVYESKGWKITYERPDYTETRPSYFVFKEK